jgi:hypothetical protein
MKIRMLLVGALMCLFVVDATAQVPKPWLGTWKLNVAKSKSSPGVPLPKSWIDTVEAVEGGLKNTSVRVLSDGKAARFESTNKLDGKDYPWTGSAFADAISMTKVDDFTNEWALKKDGKVVQSGRTAFSRDGKLRTITFKGTGVSSGKKGEGTVVFDRQ